MISDEVGLNMAEAVQRKPLLIEIGVEDLPPGFVKYAREHMVSHVPQFFSRYRIEHKSLSIFCSPRRLVVLAQDCSGRQPNEEREHIGPPAAVAFDKEGRPTKAAIGFARSVGVPVETLQRFQTNRGEYIRARKTVEGKSLFEVIPEMVRSMLSSFSFPKMMRWSKTRLLFGRPIRSLLLLWGEELIECSLFGLSSRRTTMVHWTQEPPSVPVPDASSFLRVLAEHSILPDQASRKQVILDGIARIEKELGCCVICDDEMVSILADSTESPRVFYGRFDPEFLELPQPVLTTSMWHHQYALAVKRSPSAAGPGEEGDELLPYFVAVASSPSASIETVRGGNEAVLKARLDDAAFFLAEDRKTPLEKRVPRLRGMIFHKGLGDLVMKSQRLVTLSALIAREAFSGQDTVQGLDKDLFIKYCQRAAQLCKADLVTKMVGEFPELQGVMGGIYARYAGEPEPVADAIGEHYRPRGYRDRPPATDCGRVLALADKLDTVCAFLAAGRAPRGSEDPLGLRRDALGIVSVLLASGYRLPLRKPIGAALGLLAESGLVKPGESVEEEVLSFIKQRLMRKLVEAGVRRDLAEAVVSHECDDLVDLKKRAEALFEFSRDSQFEALTIGLKRASHILEGRPGRVDPRILVEPEEKELFSQIENVENRVYENVAACNYVEAFRLIASLRRYIDDFFDHVLVMCEDTKLRQNRLALLARLVKMFDTIANFSKIVIPRKGGD